MTIYFGSVAKASGLRWSKVETVETAMNIYRGFLNENFSFFFLRNYLLCCLEKCLRKVLSPPTFKILPRKKSFCRKHKNRPKSFLFEISNRIKWNFTSFKRLAGARLKIKKLSGRVSSCLMVGQSAGNTVELPKLLRGGHSVPCCWCCCWSRLQEHLSDVLRNTVAGGKLEWKFFESDRKANKETLRGNRFDDSRNRSLRFPAVLAYYECIFFFWKRSKETRFGIVFFFNSSDTVQDLFSWEERERNSLTSTSYLT